MMQSLYVPRAGLLHRVPAGGKLLALVVLGAAVVVAPSAVVVAAVLGGVVVAALVLGRLPLRWLARQVRTVLFWLVVVAVLQGALAGVLPALVACGRLLALVLAAAVVTATTRVSAMVAAVERVCAPLAWVGVRPARIGLLVALAVRFVPLVAERAGRIREAQLARGGRVRGVRATVRTAVPLLVQVLRMAGAVAEALDARGADDVPLPRRGPVRGARSGGGAA